MPKTTSGKLRRVLAKEWCLKDQWKSATVIDLWKQDPNDEDVQTHQQQDPTSAMTTPPGCEMHAYPKQGNCDLGLPEPNSLNIIQDRERNVSTQIKVAHQSGSEQLTQARNSIVQSSKPPTKPTSLAIPPEQGLLDQTISSVSEAFRQATGRDVPIDEPFAELGMSSMEVAQLHATLETTLDAPPDTLSIQWLFESELTIQQLAERFLNGDNELTGGNEPDMVLDITLEHLENNLNRPVDTNTSLDDLPMSETQARNVRASIWKKQAGFPLKWL